MINIPRKLSSGFFSTGYSRPSTKSTTVEGLVLNHETRCPIQGVEVAVFVCSEEGERVLVQQMFSDNNGYFSGTFQAEASTFIITPVKENFNFSGSYSNLKAGEQAFGCEMVKHGKKQFYSLTMEDRVGANMGVKKSKPFSSKVSDNGFIRKLIALPFLRFFFS